MRFSTFPRVSLLLTLLLVAPRTWAQTDTLVQLNSLFERWDNSTPGAVVAIQRGPKVVYQRAFGLADLEHGEPITWETIFESGSVAKQVTATALLLLVQEGKVNLDDPVQKYLPELPTYETPLKVRYLLSHTSGLRDWGSLFALTGWPRSTKVFDQRQAVKMIYRQKHTNFPPGSNYNYSNSNFVLLVEIVERVSGISFETFTRQRLFEPLGMKHAEWRSNFRKVIPGRSVAYGWNGSAYEQVMPFENVFGPGGLLITADDLLKWNTLLSTKSIGGEAMYQLRTTTAKLTTGEDTHYAAGLAIGEWNGFKEISHSGATAGYRAWLAYYPEVNLSVVLLSNDGSLPPANLGHQMAEIFLGTPKTPQARSAANLSPASFQPWTGIYRSVPGYGLVNLKVEGEKITLNNQALIPVHPDTLVYGQTRWVRTSTGLEQHTNQQVNEYKKQRPATNSKANYAGKYHSRELEVTYEITQDSEGLMVHIPILPPARLTPEYENAFSTTDGDLLEFQVDKSGKVTGLLISTSRVFNLEFKKETAPAK